MEYAKHGIKRTAKLQPLRLQVEPASNASALSLPNEVQVIRDEFCPHGWLFRRSWSIGLRSPWHVLCLACQTIYELHLLRIGACATLHANSPLWMSSLFIERLSLFFRSFVSVYGSRIWIPENAAKPRLGTNPSGNHGGKSQHQHKAWCLRQQCVRGVGSVRTSTFIL